MSDEVKLERKGGRENPWVLDLRDFEALLEGSAPSEPGQVGRFSLGLGQYGESWYFTLTDREKRQASSGWGRTPLSALRDLVDALSAGKAKWKPFTASGKKKDPDSPF